MPERGRGRERRIGKAVGCGGHALWVCAGLVLAGSAAAQDASTRALLIGDSITEGAVAGGGHGYSDILASLLADSHEIVNLGCPGASSWDWTLSRGSDICTDFLPASLFESLAIPNLPADFVTIMLGTNDAMGFLEYGPIAPPQYRANLDEIIASSFMNGARTVLLMSPPPRCDPDSAHSQRLRHYRLEGIDICSNDPDVHCGVDVYNLLDDDDFESCNNVHPNQQGHGKIAAALRSELLAHEPQSPRIQVYQWFIPAVPFPVPALFPVTIYSSPTFDAVTRVDPATLRFGETGWEDSLLSSPLIGGFACTAIDVDQDDRVDLVCAHEVRKTGLELGDGEAWLRGRTANGSALDSVFVGSAETLPDFPPDLLPDLEGLF